MRRRDRRDGRREAVDELASDGREQPEELGRGLLVLLVLWGSTVSTPGPAAAFGTIDGGGQNREHERITRAAVACPAGTGSDGDCFEPRSADQLAGHGKRFGAIGSPDLTEVSDPAAHCDDADFLAGGYPRTRDEATASLLDCVDHLRGRFREAIDEAGDLLDDEGEIIPAEVNLDTDCELDATHRTARQVQVPGEFRSGAARGAGLLLAQQLGRRGGSGPSDRRRQSAGPESAGAEPDPRPAWQRRADRAGRPDDRMLRAPRQRARRRGVRAAGHPCRPQQGPRAHRSEHRQRHESDDAARQGGQQLRESRGGCHRRDASSMAGLPGRAGSQLRREEGVAHGLRPHPRRSVERLRRAPTVRPSFSSFPAFSLSFWSRGSWCSGGDGGRSRSRAPIVVEVAALAHLLQPAHQSGGAQRRRRPAAGRRPASRPGARAPPRSASRRGRRGSRRAPRRPRPPRCRGRSGC